MTKKTYKADLHVHSRHSQRPSSWVLKKIGCSESYTEPLDLYRTLKRRGMDFVTITDHNTIKGCLEIAHLKDTLISEEVTTYFPDERCKLHILVYNISEKHHEEIGRLRNNVFDLVDYLNAEGIVHAVAHPMYSINGLLQVDHFQKLLLLFRNFELNGARDDLQNTIITRIISELTKEKIDELAHALDMAPLIERPWKKHVISGSDDHSSLYMGSSYTEIQGISSCSVEQFLSGIEQGLATVQTHNATPETLAHNIYSIMYQFYDKTYKLHQWINDSSLSGFLRDILSPKSLSPGFLGKTTQRSKKKDSFDFAGSTTLDQILENAKNAIFSDPHLKSRARKHKDPSQHSEYMWLQFVNSVSDMVMPQFADEILSKLNNVDLFYLFSAICSSASIYMMLSPYFVAYSLFSRDRAFSLDCLESHLGGGKGAVTKPRHIAMFTDTFNGINGVATAIQSEVEAARITGKRLTLVTCDPARESDSNVAVFKPNGEFDLPEYPELKIYYPPVLKILSYCYQEHVSHIHAETPGTMGLTALVIANLLNVPFRGTYHTSLPQTAGTLTDDPQIEELFWKYIVWFYGHMETVYVPSSVTARELIAKGLPKEKIVVHRLGVNTTGFHPEKRNGFFSTHYNIKDSDIKLLYVGRVSQEKNLGILETAMRKIRRLRDDIHLVIVGEGPYLPEMKAALEGLPVLFTGYLTGDDLAQAFASSDIFVFPSTVDTMGNVVIEAQASGLPVIVTDKGGPSENMIPKETGFVVPADEHMPDHFVEAILNLCESPALMETMRKKARRYTQRRSFEHTFLDFWNNYF